MNKTRLNHKAGELAYLDSFDGLIPCKVLKITKESGQYSSNSPSIINTRVQVKITANAGGYDKGEIVEYSAIAIIPRNCVRVYNGQYKIGFYNWETE